MKTLPASKIPKNIIEKYDLIYVYTNDTGIKRVKKGRGFSYIDPNGNIIQDKKEKKRLKNIAVPPTYNEVWYCPHHGGHIQATGLDSKSKKQYFYHPEWEAIRESTKFSFMLQFGKCLPSFRRKVQAGLKDTTLNQETILCAMARILDRTGLRVGNEEATKINNTHGLTTLEKNHIEKNDDEIDLVYKGKGGKEIQRHLTDKKISEVIEQCVEINGQRLFQYNDRNGTTKTISSGDLNEFIKNIMGDSFTAKDFRTWRFSCLFLEKLLGIKNDENITLKALLEDVSKISGNTSSVLQSSYIHPGLIQIAKNKNLKILSKPEEPIAGLRQVENIFLRYLESNHAKNIF